MLGLHPQGLAIENGLHEFSPTTRSSSALAAASASPSRDLRRPPAGLNVPTGANLEVPARIVLTVGSDCAIGKMTVALELDARRAARGSPPCFVPTGQTGIAIAGWGISVDSVVADFVAGATERLVVEGAGAGESCSWSKGRARSSIRPTRVSPSASSTAPCRMRSCSVTWREQRRWRATPAIR